VTGLVTSDRKVQQVETSDGVIETRAIVVAAGYRSSELLAGVGVDLPLTAIRHDIALAKRGPNFEGLHPVVSDRVSGLFYRYDDNNLTRIGTTAPHDGLVDPNVESHEPPSAEERDRMVAGFAKRFPLDVTVGGAGFSCCYDCTPDIQPALGPVPGIEGLYVAAGFSGHGFKLSPVVGEIMADSILTGQTSLIDLDLFSILRFAEGRLISPDHAYSVATL
jgi:glycine/D-amino acid oxidase-like deaminating enzyme